MSVYTYDELRKKYVLIDQSDDPEQLELPFDEED